MGAGEGVVIRHSGIMHVGVRGLVRIMGAMGTRRHSAAPGRPLQSNRVPPVPACDREQERVRRRILPTPCFNTCRSVRMSRSG